VSRALEGRDARAKGDWQGMNWCRPSTRLAIYLRDGMACVWCREGVEHGTVLTLDHVVAHSRGGSNLPGNLVTACKRCNDSRGARTVPAFARVVAAYLDHGVRAERIRLHVRRCAVRELPRGEALALLARRGSLGAVLAERRAS
jgi:hypothetical protein